MKLKEILDMEVARVDGLSVWEFSPLRSHFYSVGELNLFELDEEKLEIVDKNAKVNWVAYKQIDGRRMWGLGYITFKDEPFMIIRNAGREGRDFSDEFVFDDKIYSEFLSFIYALKGTMLHEDEVFDLDPDIYDLDYFYSEKLEWVLNDQNY